MTEERLKEIEGRVGPALESGAGALNLLRMTGELVAEVRRLRTALEALVRGPTHEALELARAALAGEPARSAASADPHDWETYETDGGMGFGRTCRRCGEKQRAVFGQGLVVREGDGSCGGDAT